jgi:hypothetical protein
MEVEHRERGTKMTNSLYSVIYQSMQGNAAKHSDIELMPKTLIWEVLGFNLSQDIGYPNRSFIIFLIYPGRCQDCPQLGHKCFQIVFPFIIDKSSYHLTLCILGTD